MQRGALILCGGRSSRMGVDKALLPFGDETMIERMVRIVGSVVGHANIVVAAAAGQKLPNVAATIIRDEAEYQGPLSAIKFGVRVLSTGVESVFVTGCDTPLLSGAVIDFLFGRLREFDCVLPQDADRLHPLCAVYHKSALQDVRETQGRSLHEYLASLNAHLIPCDEFRVVDPELNFLRNINTHVDYVAALDVAGLSTP